MLIMRFKWIQDVKLDEASTKTQEEFFKQWKNNYLENLKNGFFYASKNRNHIGIYEMKDNIFADTPLVISTIGPSLSKQLSLLKEYQNNFIHMTMDVTLPLLIKEGILPHFVVTIDPSRRIFELIETYLKYSDRMVLITPTATCPDILLNWKGPIIFYQQKDVLRAQHEFLTMLNHNPCTYFYGELMNAGTVVCAAAQAAIKMKFKNIALVGYDLAYTDGKSYCDESFGYMHNIPDAPKDSETYINTYNNIKQHCRDVAIKATDINGAETSTSALFSTYASYYYMLLHNYFQFYKDLNIYNCTEHGILFEPKFMKKETFKNWLDTYCKSELQDITKQIGYRLKFKSLTT